MTFAVSVLVPAVTSCSNVESSNILTKDLNHPEDGDSLHDQSAACPSLGATHQKPGLVLNTAGEDETEDTNCDEEDLRRITPTLGYLSDESITERHSNPTEDSTASAEVLQMIQTLYTDLIDALRRVVIVFPEGEEMKEALRSYLSIYRQQVEAEKRRSSNEREDRYIFLGNVYESYEHQQTTLQFMPVMVMDNNLSGATYVPRLADEFESIFHVGIWRGLGGRAGRKPDQPSTRRLARELRSITPRTVADAKRRLFNRPEQGRRFLKTIQFMHPQLLRLCLSWLECLWCSYSARIINGKERSRLSRKGIKDVPSVDYNDVPPGAFLYYSGARTRDCDGPCCSSHWTQWTKRMHLKDLDL